MIRFLADENFNGHVISALRRSHPEIDLVTVQELGSTSTEDPDVLEWAARDQRLILTNDSSTMIGFAKERVAAGKSMPGLVEIRKRARIQLVVEDLAILAHCSESGQWEGQVIYVPFSP